MRKAIATGNPVRSIVVDRPRPGDAIGGALRAIFLGDRHIPDDMKCLLSRLDTAEPSHF